MKYIKLNRKFTLLSIAMIIFLLILLFINTTTSINKHAIINEPFFLKCKASIYGYENDTSILSLFFVDSKTNSLVLKLIKDSEKIAFDNEEYIEILDKNIIRGSTYKNMSLYTLDLKVKFKKTGNISYENLYFVNSDNEVVDKLQVGEYTFLILNQSHNNKGLNILSHSSIRPFLDKYLLILENISGEQIKLKNIESGKFSDYVDEILIQINEDKVKEYKYGEDIVLSPKDTVKIEINFNKSKSNDHKDYDVFIFNPNIKYQDNGIIQNKISMRSFYGVSFNEKRMKKLLSKFMNSN
ncbi:hypothetical protein [Paramaledivibacter caminithermalis]|uniref:Uncharacterized protein n=1 Tax=Paramaledivibacter caminithermalis (strain DSM 15212 / CIP 107654 / DViRD3) TaxID=1121301 RepID=A0A1M6N1H1_PARC5|nr:hypothetical protein [Paramaledivibacter caminithermalis]SHJ89502.1 hypothetical protein SAMN02745912_01526 [Paramaledivibacter caminithermalis DSM 15212]